MIQRYISKISGPLLDRIDIHIDGPGGELTKKAQHDEPESSAGFWSAWIRGREIQVDAPFFRTRKALLQRHAPQSHFANSRSPRLRAPGSNAPWPSKG